MPDAVLPTLRLLVRFVGVELEPVIDLPQHHGMPWGLHEGSVDEFGVRLIFRVQIVLPPSDAVVLPVGLLWLMITWGVMMREALRGWGRIDACSHVLRVILGRKAAESLFHSRRRLLVDMIGNAKVLLSSGELVTGGKVDARKVAWAEA